MHVLLHPTTIQAEPTFKDIFVFLQKDMRQYPDCLIYCVLYTAGQIVGQTIIMEGKGSIDDNAYVQQQGAGQALLM